MGSTLEPKWTQNYTSNLMGFVKVFHRELLSFLGRRLVFDLMRLGVGSKVLYYTDFIASH